MELYQNKQMQGKEPFLKKIIKFLIFFTLVFLFQNKEYINAEPIDELNKKKIINEIIKLRKFSSNFIQTDGITVEEGKIFVKNSRIRIDYNHPSKLRFVLAKDKAMYYNIDNQEVSYFNPEKNIAKVVFGIFYDEDFFVNTNFNKEKNFIVITKKILIDDEENILKVYFEDTPLLFRKITIKSDNNYLNFAVFNLEFNPSLKKNFFSLANPTIKN